LVACSSKRLSILMMTSGSGICIAQLKTVLFESVLMLIIWLDMYGFLRFCFDARYLCNYTCSEPCNQISRDIKDFPNANGISNIKFLQSM